LAVADVYDALRSIRVYKLSFSHKNAFDIITQGDGRTMPEHFNPHVLKAFKDVSHNSKIFIYHIKFKTGGRKNIEE
jgi:putative two-component system response regulator